MLTDIRLHDLLEPGARALGFDILAVERSGRGRSTVLRVYIDGPDGVTVVLRPLAVQPASVARLRRGRRPAAYCER